MINILLPHVLFVGGSILAVNGLIKIRRKSSQKSTINGHMPHQLVDSEFNKELIAMIEIALEAGENILKTLKLDKSITIKGQEDSVDFVTATDKLNEKIILSKLHDLFPTYTFIGEVRIYI